MKSASEAPPDGLLLIDKEMGKTSFHYVSLFRSRTNVRTIGHGGTLDPFATGLLLLLIGRNTTRQSSKFLNSDKEYLATLRLGIETDSYDLDGALIATCDRIPSQQEVFDSLHHFQGAQMQVPPMFSAKKIQGKRLYELARKGITVERTSVSVTMQIELIDYHYPFLQLKVACSKGTYIRSLAHDLGSRLKTGAHLSALRRTKSGPYSIDAALPPDKLTSLNAIKQHLIQ